MWRSETDLSGSWWPGLVCRRNLTLPTNRQGRRSWTGFLSSAGRGENKVLERPLKRDWERLEQSVFRNKLCFFCTTDRTTPVSGYCFKCHTACDARIPFFRVVDMATDHTHHLLHRAPHQIRLQPQGVIPPGCDVSKTLRCLELVEGFSCVPEIELGYDKPGFFQAVQCIPDRAG